MSRYIDAEWLLNFFEPYPDDYHTPLGTLRACVDDAPSIDLDDYVPREFHDKTCEAMAKRHQNEIASMPSVVRCEDCKYWLSDKPIKNKWFQNGEIDQCKWRTDESPNDDGFCSYGEREGE